MKVSKSKIALGFPSILQILSKFPGSSKSNPHQTTCLYIVQALLKPENVWYCNKRARMFDGRQKSFKSWDAYIVFS